MSGCPPAERAEEAFGLSDLIPHDERWEQVELEIAQTRRFVARVAETLNSVDGRLPTGVLDSLKTLGT